MEQQQEKREQRFPVEDWRYEVANGDTMQGYQEWLMSRIESEETAKQQGDFIRSHCNTENPHMPEQEVYKVYQHLLPALINGDLSGLEEEEVELVGQIETYIDGRIISTDPNREHFFSFPDHDGEMGDVEEVILVDIKQEKGAAKC